MIIYDFLNKNMISSIKLKFSNKKYDLLTKIRRAFGPRRVRASAGRMNFCVLLPLGGRFTFPPTYITVL